MSGGTEATEETPAAALDAALATLAGSPRNHLVAFSGGADSALLLTLLAERLPRRRLRAVHVHHGWNADADAWAQHCRDFARGLGLHCKVLRVDAAPLAGEGPEAAARNARYRAISEMMMVGDVVWTAHHADDQAETLLLALLRGGATRGVAGMPAWRRLGTGLLARPWLRVARDRIRAEIERRELAVIEDPANADPAFDRAFLRTEVLPALRRRWPEFATTMARAAELFAGDAHLTDALAAGDFVHCRGAAENTLSCNALLGLNHARQRNLIRWWLRRQELPVPPEKRLNEALAQFARAGADRNPVIDWPGAELRRWRGLVWALPTLPDIDAETVRDWPDPDEPLVLPDRVLVRSRIEHPEVLVSGRVQIRYRRGGERIRLPGRESTIDLKRWLAQAGVPPWERERLPLIHVDGELVTVAKPRWRSRSGR